MAQVLTERIDRGTTVVDRGETNELFHRWQVDGDQRARELLVERFLPLARKLARRYSGAHEPFDDLLQVASLGLVKAIDRFDTSRGTAFSSFAVPTILGELKRYFRDLGWSVHVPRGAQEMALKVEEARQRMSSRTGRPPSVPELAQYLELSVEDVLEALRRPAPTTPRRSTLPGTTARTSPARWATPSARWTSGSNSSTTSVTIAAAARTSAPASVACCCCASSRT